MKISERPLRITFLVLIGLIGGVAGSLGMSLFLLPSITSVSSSTQTVGTTIPVKAFLNTPRLPTVSVALVSKQSLKDVVGGSVVVEDAKVGTATILTADGWLVTDSAQLASIQDPIVLLPNGVAKSPVNSIADSQAGLTYFRVDATNLPVIAFGESSSLTPGAFVFVVTPDSVVLPSGLLNTHTRLMSDAKNIVRPSDLSTDRMLIQATGEKRIGGAGVVNNAGALIGILSSVVQPNGVREVISVEVVQKSLREIVRTGALHHLTLGVSTVDVSELSKRNENLSGVFGAIVASVDVNGPAANAGLQIGDRITVFGGDALDGSKLLSDFLLNYRVGDQVPVTFIRGGEEKTTTVTVGEVKVSEKKVGK